jgi:hypothetical protein
MQPTIMRGGLGALSLPTSAGLRLETRPSSGEERDREDYGEGIEGGGSQLLAEATRKP